MSRTSSCSGPGLVYSELGAGGSEGGALERAEEGRSSRDQFPDARSLHWLHWRIIRPHLWCSCLLAHSFAMTPCNGCRGRSIEKFGIAKPRGIVRGMTGLPSWDEWPAGTGHS